jgi:hypothetical protein
MKNGVIALLKLASKLLYKNKYILFNINAYINNCIGCFRIIFFKFILIVDNFNIQAERNMLNYDNRNRYNYKKN